MQSSSIRQGASMYSSNNFIEKLSNNLLHRFDSGLNSTILLIGP